MAVTVFDAGVLIGWLDSDDAFHRSATTTMAAARQRGDRLVVPASAYAELLVRPHTNDTVADVEMALSEMAIRIEPLTAAIAAAAAALSARHGRRLRLPDALVVATAASLRATHLVTTDREWPVADLNVRTIDIIDPA